MRIEAALPTVSIVVPNYNHAPYLAKRLDSIFNQSYRDFEVLLLDDCSTDGSQEILTRYGDRPEVSQVVFNEENGGNPFLQWKKGLELARGEYVWIAESDDWAESDFLERLIGLLDTQPEIGFFFCKSINVDSEGVPLRQPTRAERLLGDTMWKESFVADGGQLIHYFLPDVGAIQNTSAAVFRRRVGERYIDQIVDFDRVGDYLFWVLMTADGVVGFLKEPLSFIRRASSNVGGEGYYLAKEKQLLGIHRHLIGQLGLPPRQILRMGRYHLKWLFRRRTLRLLSLLGRQKVFR